MISAYTPGFGSFPGSRSLSQTSPTWPWRCDVVDDELG
jgi:hypothetical protein